MIGRGDIGHGRSYFEGRSAISAALCPDCCVRPDLAAFASADATAPSWVIIQGGTLRCRKIEPNAARTALHVTVGNLSSNPRRAVSLTGLTRSGYGSINPWPLQSTL